MMTKSRTLAELAVVLLVGVLPMIVIGATLYAPSIDEPPPPFYQADIAPSLRQGLMLAAFALFVLAPVIAIRRSGKAAAEFGYRRGTLADVGWGLAGLVLNYALGWAIWGLFFATGFPLGREKVQAFHYVHAASFAEMASSWPWYVLVVLAEETMARCYLITRLRDVTGNKWLAVLGSSLLFAAWHSFWGPAGMLHVFKAGMVFGALFVLRGGVMAPAVSHFVFDALTLLPR